MTGVWNNILSIDSDLLIKILCSLMYILFAKMEMNFGFTVSSANLRNYCMDWDFCLSFQSDVLFISWWLYYNADNPRKWWSQNNFTNISLRPVPSSTKPRKERFMISVYSLQDIYLQRVQIFWNSSLIRFFIHPTRGDETSTFVSDGNVNLSN